MAETPETHSDNQELAVITGLLRHLIDDQHEIIRRLSALEAMATRQDKILTEFEPMLRRRVKPLDFLPRKTPQRHKLTDGARALAEEMYTDG